MKSERGITLASLAVYIAVIFIVLVLLTTVMTYFKVNMNDFSTKSTADIEFDKFNLYFIEEVKKTNNSVNKTSSNQTKVVFSTGNTYEFKSSEKAIYLNSNIKIAENVESCNFTYQNISSKETITVYMKISDTERTNSYTVGSQSQNDSNSEDYENYIYKQSTAEGTGPILLENSIGTTIKDYKIYGSESGVGDFVTDISSENYGKYKITITVTEVTTIAKSLVVATDINGYSYETKSNSVNIYLNEPLWKNGDDVDYIDFEKGKVVRKVLSEYYEQSIGTPYLYTYDGSSILEVNTSSAPSKISVVYYSN